MATEGHGEEKRKSIIIIIIIIIIINEIRNWNIQGFRIGEDPGPWLCSGRWEKQKVKDGAR